MEQTTIESRVASAILERNVGNIEIEGVTYEIAPPSIATLIVVSEFIASLPIVEKVENGRVYTVEGNSGDSVRQNSYPIGYYEIYGYGTPAY